MGQLSCVVCSATLRGVKAIPVSVEVVITSGIPSFSIVGMPDVAIQESRERVRAAIKASGFSMPSDKIVVNLAPGSLKNAGQVSICQLLWEFLSPRSKSHLSI